MFESLFLIIRQQFFFLSIQILGNAFNFVGGELLMVELPLVVEGLIEIESWVLVVVLKLLAEVKIAYKSHVGGEGPAMEFQYLIIQAATLG